MLAIADEIGPPHRLQRLAQQGPVVGIVVAQKGFVQAATASFAESTAIFATLTPAPSGLTVLVELAVLAELARLHRAVERGVALAEALALAGEYRAALVLDVALLLGTRPHLGPAARLVLGHLLGILALHVEVLGRAGAQRERQRHRAPHKGRPVPRHECPPLGDATGSVSANPLRYNRKIGLAGLSGKALVSNRQSPG